MMRKVRVIEGFTRDLGLPADVLASGAEIYNAARPFPCHQEWTGEFMSGVFYGAIYADREDADLYRERADALDAARLVFVSRDEVINWTVGYCEAIGVDPADFSYEVYCRSYLNHYEQEGL